MESLKPLQGMKDVFDSRARTKRIMLNSLAEFLESCEFEQIDLRLLEEYLVRSFNKISTIGSLICNP